MHGLAASWEGQSFADKKVYVAPQSQLLFSRAVRIPITELLLQNNQISTPTNRMMALQHYVESNTTYKGIQNIDSLIGYMKNISEPYKDIPDNTTFDGLWAWSDPINCHPETYLNDPWACNFIAFTNCTDRIKSTKIKPLHFARHWNGEENSTDFLSNPVAIGGAGGITQILRNIYDDSPYLSQNDWLRIRLYAFFDRPNAQMRHFIRKSIRDIKPVHDVVRELIPVSSHESVINNYAGVEHPQKVGFCK